MAGESGVGLWEQYLPEERHEKAGVEGGWSLDYRERINPPLHDSSSHYPRQWRWCRRPVPAAPGLSQGSVAVSLPW